MATAWRSTEGTSFRGFRADGEIRIHNAQIGGRLWIGRAEFVNPKALALSITTCQMREFMLGPTAIEGTVDLRYSQTIVQYSEPITGTRARKPNTSANLRQPERRPNRQRDEWLPMPRKHGDVRLGSQIGLNGHGLT